MYSITRYLYLKNILFFKTIRYLYLRNKLFFQHISYFDMRYDIFYNVLYSLRNDVVLCVISYVIQCDIR